MNYGSLGWKKYSTNPPIYIYWQHTKKVQRFSKLKANSMEVYGTSDICETNTLKFMTFCPHKNLGKQCTENFTTRWSHSESPLWNILCLSVFDTKVTAQISNPVSSHRPIQMIFQSTIGCTTRVGKTVVRFVKCSCLQRYWQGRGSKEVYTVTTRMILRWTGSGRDSFIVSLN